MRNMIYINGSPRGEKGSNSAHILRDIIGFLKEEGLVEGNPDLLTLPRNLPENPESTLKEMNEAEVWILSLPLYVDTLPGHLCRWLSLFQEYRAKQGSTGRIRVYGVVNCGFPEAVQNRDALKILELFCCQNGLEWRFGIGLGMGEAYKEMAGMPLRSPGKSKILKAFQGLAGDIRNPSGPGGEIALAAVKFPPFLYRLMGSVGWGFMARKNGLKRRDLYARPLME